MKITLVNTSDSSGGAAIAAYRLLDSMNANGTDARLLVQQSSREDERISATNDSAYKRLLSTYRMLADQLSFTIKEQSKDVRFAFSVGQRGEDISEHPLIQSADLIHLHWINKGFISINGLSKLMALGKPVVWTLHDMWAFTGGCHYSGSCSSYLETCGNCPFLKNPHDTDISSKIWQEKAAAYMNANLTLVTCSEWLASVAQKSNLLKEMRVESIPNPIDTRLYQPIMKEKARGALGLSSDKLMLLFGAMNVADKRKGFDHLTAALKSLVEQFPELVGKIELIVFGKFKGGELSIPEIPVHMLGSMNSEEQIIAAYNAADLFVLPSTEDNLPNTVMESLACGTPVVAFNIGGIPEMVDHKVNGYLASPLDATDLAQGLDWVLRNATAIDMSGNATKKVAEKYNYSVVAQKYTSLYKELLEVV